MARELTRQDLLDLARGAAFLGTGGGGDPYIGRLMVERARDEGCSVVLGERARAGGCSVVLVPLEEVPDDWFVIPTAMMGAPTVMIEKIPRGYEAVASLRALEAELGRKAEATMQTHVA